MSWTDARIEERFDQVDNRLDRMDDRLNRMDDRLNRIDERLDGIQRTMLHVGVMLAAANLAGFAALVGLFATRL